MSSFREKQLQKVKTKPGYQRYCECVERESRHPSLKGTWHPRTPDAHRIRSSRAFKSDVSRWAKQLHLWGNLSSDDLKKVRRMKLWELRDFQPSRQAPVSPSRLAAVLRTGERDHSVTELLSQGCPVLFSALVPGRLSVDADLLLDAIEM
ncbi:MAG: hypothetical protein KVP17_003275 [Porospora cf. gigantea B]|uniref:uncharacterized protein n=1 Tax=Porospora cf. gigantea B TaxID=2853592 RepID=UPI0035719AA6|nr:MAG: hypothetical protein KVP17_003275 [Porospora cf. gigantea B]